MVKVMRIREPKSQFSSSILVLLERRTRSRDAEIFKDTHNISLILVSAILLNKNLGDIYLHTVTHWTPSYFDFDCTLDTSELKPERIISQFSLQFLSRLSSVSCCGSMNPLNWLASINENRQENEPFDTSLVLPLTVGLGTVVVSVLLGYRGGILGSSKRSLISKSIKESTDMVSSSRDAVKRKSTKSTAKPKLSLSHISESKPQAKDEPTPQVTAPDVAQGYVQSPPVLSNHVLPSAAAQDHPKHHNKGPSPTSFTSDKPKSEPSPHKPSPPTENKKPKKTKRPTKQEPPPAPTPEIESTETDTTWVTVIPKKVRPPTVGSSNESFQAPLSTLPSSTSSAKKKGREPVITEESRTNAPVPPNQRSEPIEDEIIVPSPAASLPSVQQTNPSPTASQTVAPVSKAKPLPEAQQVKSAKHGDELSATVTRPSDPTPAVPTPSAVSSAPMTGTDETEKLTAAYEDILRRTLGSETVDSVRGLLGLSDSSTSGTTPPISKSLAAATHLPAANELYTRHLSAQVEAKEAECQLLRSEVIHLREEVKRIATSVPQPCPRPSADVETMTELQVEAKPEPKPDSAPTLVKASNPQRSQSPDSVLLRTLQDEIARLAKEITLSHQRNENLEARLATTTKQMNVAKRESTQLANSLQKELTAQTQRADRLEDQRAQIETQLQDLIQQNEIQRRKTEENEHVSAQQLERARCEYNTLLTQKDQWDQERASLLLDKDRLARDFDLLNAKHNAVVTEMDSVQRNADDLRQRLQDAEIRVQSLDHDRTASLMESDKKLTQLESELVELRAREQEARTLQAAAESTVVTLTSELNQANSALALQSQQSADEQRSKIVDLELALNEERAKREQFEFHLAEAMRTHPDSVTQPVVAEPRVCVDATTQADPEPSTEYEPSETVRELVEEEPVMQSTVTAQVDETKYKFTDLEAQVAHYKSALDVTETMLSKLQSSVDEEEHRWREALGASKMECELLELKIAKLEATVSTLTGERDELNKTIQELQIDHQFNLAQAELQSTDEQRSSAHSISVARIMDTVNYDENTPKPDLIRLLNRFRCLVQIEHETLKREQANCARLQSQLSTLERHTHNGNANSTTLTMQPTAIATQPFSDPPEVSTYDAENLAGAASSSNGMGHKFPHSTKLQDAEANGVSNRLPPQTSPNGLGCELNGTSG
ncbi:hypothetical protein CRM22_003986 [Opisthorchis felineus]|uniref:Uncharacterized protein n=1 Tax=Opisthorchis felineus TaxID=147828 RepID=A0A4S2LYF5_OPIFE|nr:hypothetical protein CRM22_003986 [Opisthorchis felineus]